MKQYYLDFKDDKYIFERAVLECFDGKWRRNDVLSFIEKYAGIPRHEILIDELETKEDRAHENEHGAIRIEAVESCGLALSEAIYNILENHLEDIDIDPPKIRRRPDGMTGKMRDIALLCIMHQLIEHTAFNLLQPLFEHKLYPTQHASIPGGGQTRLKNQVHKYLRKSGLNIKYAVKTDMKHAYQSIKYEKVIKELKKDIPNAQHIIKIIEFLGQLAPDGHLIIGGYLDAWLFNYMMSKVITNAYELGSIRRGKFIRYAIRIVTFMDDMLILTSSIKAIKKIIKETEKFAFNELGMTLKVETGIIKLLSVEQERSRRNKKGARHGCPVIDMAGYKISRSHISIRRRVFLRIRRQFLRAHKEYKETGSISIQRARKLISYNGFIKQSNSQKFVEKYHVVEIMEVAKKVASFYAYLTNRKRMEKLNDLRKRTIKYKSKLGNDRKSPGWPAENYHYKKCLGNRRRRRNTIPI